jgi:hypothetical protein
MDLPLWGPITPAPQPSCPVTAIREIPYDKLGEDPIAIASTCFSPRAGSIAGPRRRLDVG